MAFRSERFAAIAAGAVVLLLSGCGAGTPAASDAGAGTPNPLETTAETTTSPSDPPAAAADCDAVFTDAEYERLAAEGQALQETPYLLGPAMERMAADGALVCVWTKPNSDVSVTYARLEVGAEGEAWLAELQGEGWLEDTERGDGTYLAPADYDANYQPSVQLNDGVLHFASYNPVLGSVLELQ